MVRWLIGEGNASVDQANDVGETPLFAAVQQCSQGILRQANSEAMPLSSAGCKCGTDMLRWLVEEGHAKCEQRSPRVERRRCWQRYVQR
jgi:hypothetical protein